MKKIVIPVIVAVIVFAALPIINGILMEKAVNSAFTNLNELYKDTGTGYKLEVISFDRGLFTSSIDWRLDLGNLEPFYGISEVMFKDSARHGFTGVTSTTSLENNEWFTAFINDRLAGKNPLEITTFYSLFGEIESTWTISPFSFAVEKQTVNVAEGEMEIDTDTELREFETSLEWDGLNMGETLHIGEIEMESELEIVSTYLWDGTAGFSADSFRISEGSADVAVNGISAEYEISTDTDANSMSLQTTLAVQSLATPDRTIHGAKGTFAVNNVDARAYEAFMEQYMDVVSEALTAVAEMEKSGEEDTEMIEQQITAAGLQMMAAYEKLLRKDLEIKISDVNMKLDEGDVKLDATIRLLKDMTLMQFAPIIGQPSLILDILYLKTEIQWPASLAGDSPMLFSPPFPGMEVGFFIKDGDLVTHSAETRNNALILNNTTVDLDKLQQVMQQ